MSTNSNLPPFPSLCWQYWSESAGWLCDARRRRRRRRWRHCLHREISPLRHSNQDSPITADGELMLLVAAPAISSRGKRWLEQRPASLPLQPPRPTHFFFAISHTITVFFRAISHTVAVFLLAISHRGSVPIGWNASYKGMIKLLLITIFPHWKYRLKFKCRDKISATASANTVFPRDFSYNHRLFPSNFSFSRRLFPCNFSKRVSSNWLKCFF